MNEKYTLHTGWLQFWFFSTINKKNFENDTLSEKEEMISIGFIVKNKIIVEEQNKIAEVHS